ncbi:GH32 C-terminal domain-containing protein [Bacillus sp. FJAT-28004]|uniref:GH32 C-terminal domain-containing protein n=1 Tax=Bacillus sp. FJAT-28004 TaxID=1679165 RepID=UPI0006B51D4E|nr:GH32 C-terminal domain-containing protein [Bacillus sp. FJAT-28004]
MRIRNTVTITQRFIHMPIHNDAPLSLIRLIRDGVEIKQFKLKLAAKEVHSWFTLDLKDYKGCELETESSNEVFRAEHVIFQNDQAAEGDLYREKYRPQFHFSMKKGTISELIDFYHEHGQWHLWYEHSLYENSESDKFSGYAVSKDLIHWNEADVDYNLLQTQNKKRNRKYASSLLEMPVDGNKEQTKWLCVHEDNTYSIGHLSGHRFIAESERVALWYGFHSELLSYKADNNRCFLIGFSQGMSCLEMPFNQQMLITELNLRKTEDGIKLQAAPVNELQNLRVWQRCWSEITCNDGQSFEEDLRFRIAPDEWPGIRILPAERKPDDIFSDMLEVLLELEIEADSLLEVQLYGINIVLDRAQQSIECRGVVAPLTQDSGKIKLQLLLDKASIEIFACEGEVVMSIAVEPLYEQRKIRLLCHRGKVRADSVEVFGLRSIWSNSEERLLINEAVKDNTIVYRSDSYTIFKHRVEDSVYGEPPAYVPDRNTIISPTRAIEEFSWRRTEWSDMTRVIDRDNVWQPQHGIARLPDIHTGHATIDAAYRLASDIFYRCGSKEFARPGEEGMWTAGQFQGPGDGFGVWVRDTAHVAIRTGNILDPEGARRSLLFTTKGGFDNGVDGTAMPIVGIWDYYLATGDLTLIKETWHSLKVRIAKLEESFDPDQGLIPADQSTSNDAFPEPECGGFSLATEIYFMEAFRAMSRMGVYMGESESQIKDWADRGELILGQIQSQYWKEEVGYFTSGPIGSESHQHGYWESAGQEIAMWPRYGVATPEQRRSILNRLPEVAMNEFGVNVFPYRQESNHFCNSAWVVWTSGMAAAAGREGRLDLLMTFIAQQTRNSVMNKTFYEAIDYQTGRAWRWPGQLWHAAGFISYFHLGVLGMEYDEQGLTFAPAVPETLRDLRVENLRYRMAIFDIIVHGWGTEFVMKCDGNQVDQLPAEINGKHLIEFWAVQ